MPRKPLPDILDRFDEIAALFRDKIRFIDQHRRDAAGPVPEADSPEAGGIAR